MALVEASQEQHVRTLTLNRPERRNALSMGMIDALAAELRDAAQDTAVHAVVITGAGETFCAGGDLAEGLGQNEGFAAAHAARGRFAELLAMLPELKVPVIAALQGDALGGGCGLAAACDLVIADPTARLGTPEIRLGLFPWVILAALQRDVPRKPLLEMVLTGAKLDASRALELHLINKISAPGEALAEAQALAAHIAGRSPLIVGLGKVAFHGIADRPYREALRTMTDQLTLNLLTEDAMEGIGAFLQKREPQWKGR